MALPGPRFLEEIYQIIIYIYIHSNIISHMKSNPLMPVSPIKIIKPSSNVGFCLNLHLFSRTFPLSPPVTAVANVRPVGSGLAHPWHHCGAAMLAAIRGFGADQSYDEFIYGYIYICIWLYYTRAEVHLLDLGQSHVSRSSMICLLPPLVHQGPSSPEP